MRVLVAEDDPRLASEVVTGLRAHGFEPALVSSCAGVLEAVSRDPPRVIVLDLGLSDGDALPLLPRLRALPGARVIVLTARVELDTRLRAFERGAADYVCKPFFLAELIARIRARTGAPDPSDVVKLGDLVLDRSDGSARRGDVEIALTPTERAVLVYFLTRPGRAVSRAALLEHVLPPDRAENERSVDVHVSRLRSKLGSEGAKHLETVWGVGWRFVP